METINDNIRQLLEMLDNPEAYTEQEIQDIINRDEDTRETYRMMAEAKRSSRQHQANKPIDVDAACVVFFRNFHVFQIAGLALVLAVDARHVHQRLRLLTVAVQLFPHSQILVVSCLCCHSDCKIHTAAYTKD